MKQSEKIDQLAAALSALQGKIRDVEKDSVNTYFKTPDGRPSGYASLMAVLNAVRPLLAEHGLAVCQVPNTVEGKPVLTTVLMHKSGQFIHADAPLMADKQNMQGLGSAVSYMRRFSVTALLGIAQTDDDGQGASQPPPTKAPARPIATKQANSVSSPTPNEQKRLEGLAGPSEQELKNKYGVSQAQRRAIFETASIQMGMGDEAAVLWLRQITKKPNSEEWTQDDVATLYKAIQDWK